MLSVEPHRVVRPPHAPTSAATHVADTVQTWFTLMLGSSEHVKICGARGYAEASADRGRVEVSLYEKGPPHARTQPARAHLQALLHGGLRGDTCGEARRGHHQLAREAHS